MTAIPAIAISQGILDRSNLGSDSAEPCAQFGYCCGMLVVELLNVPLNLVALLVKNTELLQASLTLFGRRQKPLLLSRHWGPGEPPLAVAAALDG